MLFLIKTGLSAIIIVLAAELSRRSVLLGGLIASLPLVSILTLCWLYLDTHSPEKISALSMSIFWMVLPSLSLFLVLPLLLKKMPFAGAMPLACIVAALCYGLALLVYERLGIKL